MAHFVRERVDFQQRLAKLGLNEQPFSISADPRFLYITDSHKWMQARIWSVIDQRQGLAVIEGPIGAGKTIFARRLYELALQDETINPVFIQTSGYPSHRGAMRDIASHFQLPARKNELDQKNDLEQFLLEQRKAGRNPVVIIDDAQHIAPRVLTVFQTLLNFDLTSKLIQVILFGQPEIHGRFARNVAVRDRVVFWHVITLMSDIEMINMIRFRLRTAGREEPLFTDRALKHLTRFSEGLPRPLIIVCNEVINILMDNGRDMADEAEAQEAIDLYAQRLAASKERSDG